MGIATQFCMVDMLIASWFRSVTVTGIHSEYHYCLSSYERRNKHLHMILIDS